MSAIHFTNVSFSYSSAVPIIEDASFDVGPGWTGLVGANGAGKSTLLRMVIGGIRPDAGSVIVVPASSPPVLCEQRVDSLTDEIGRFASNWDRGSVRLRSRLLLDPDDLIRWDSLSPGERKRWQIGTALASEPDVLLLDEPTNHLDADARSLLVSALVEFPGCGVVVSHDRDLLYQLTTRTIRIDRGSVRLWNGSYDVASRAWNEAAQSRQQEYDDLKREQQKTKKRLADQRRKADHKDAERLRILRTAGKQDPDARGAAATGRHALGQKAGARERQVTRGRLQSIASEIDSTEITKERGGAVEFEFEPARKELLSAYAGVLEVGDRRLFEADISVRRDDRIHIAGPNGAGKTSLMVCLVESAAVPTEKIFHLTQETSAEEAALFVDEVRRLPDADKGRVMSLVALLGADPGAILASDRPSPGEARKLAMAIGLGTARWILALDEPTNHLDLPSIERLESALSGFPGALLLVTHDGALARKVTTTTWTVGPDGVRSL